MGGSVTSLDYDQFDPVNMFTEGQEMHLIPIPRQANCRLPIFYFPLIAFTPGRTFPSIYSSIAPPPVDT